MLVFSTLQACKMSSLIESTSLITNTRVRRVTWVISFFVEQNIDNIDEKILDYFLIMRLENARLEN